MLAPIDPNVEYSFVDDYEQEALTRQWYALRQITQLVNYEAAEEASKHLAPIGILSSYEILKNRTDTSSSLGI